MVRSEISLWTRCLVFLAFFSPGKAVECPNPRPAGNVVLTDDAILKNEFPDGSVVTVECAYGYEKDHGSDIITCTDGTWSELQLICKSLMLKLEQDGKTITSQYLTFALYHDLQERDCGPPKPSPNLHYEKPEGTLFGARIMPFCDRGYYLQGSSSRQCLATGWSGRPTCEMITCEKPTEIPNGQIIRRPNKDYPEFEDIIEYSCDPGYTLIGNGTIFCQDDNEYSSPPPECLDISTTVRYPETTETIDTVFRVVNSRTSTTPAPSDSRGVDYELPSSTVAGTEISDYTIEITVFSLVLAAFLIIGLVCCLCYCFKRKGSYDTGEALKMKEELLQKNFQNLA